MAMFCHFPILHYDIFRLLFCINFCYLSKVQKSLNWIHSINKPVNLQGKPQHVPASQNYILSIYHSARHFVFP